MALTTYTELKASIADWLVRDDATAVIPDFIQMTEADVNRALYHYRMEETATLSVSTQFTALPSDFLGVRKLTVDGTTPTRLELMSRGMMQQQRENTLGVTGCPEYYAITDSQLEVYPAPDATYSVDLVYREAIPALNDSTATNWLLDSYPDLYLYGALAHGALWERDTEAAALWKSKFNECLAMANDASRKEQFSGAALRVKIGGLS